MITFIHPYHLIWLLLAVPLVIFYLWRLRVKRVEVATGAMWQRALPIIHPRRAWQVWRWPVSLTVQLAILTTLVLALAEPCWRRPQRVAVVLDLTASMSVEDTGGGTRANSAREKLKELAANTGYNDRMALIVVSDTIRIVSRMTNDRAGILAAVTGETLPAPGGNASVEEAVAMAHSIITVNTDGRYDPKTQNVVLISDGCFQESAEVLADPAVRWVAVGTSIANVEVQNVAVARRDAENPRKFETLVTLRNHSPREIAGTLRLEMDGKAFHEQAVKLAPGEDDASGGAADGRTTLIVAGEEPGRKEITAVFMPQNAADDFLAEDNRLSAVLYEAVTFRVTVVAEGEKNRLLEEAFRRLPYVTVRGAGVAEGKPVPPVKTGVSQDADEVTVAEIAVYDRVFPENPPRGTLALCFAPPQHPGLWMLAPDTQDFVLMPWTEGEKYHFNTAGIGFTGTHLLALAPEARRVAHTWLVSQSTLEQGTKSEDENLAKSAKAVSTTELAWGLDFVGMTKKPVDAAKTDSQNDAANFPARLVLAACDITKSDWLLADDFPQFLQYALDWLADTDATRFRLTHGVDPAWTPPEVLRDSNLNVPPHPEKAFRLPGEDIIPLWSILAVIVLTGIVVEWCFYQRRWLE